MGLASAALVYAALTALLFRNLLPDLATHVSSDLGDPMLITSIVAWNASHLPLTEAWWNFPGFAPLPGVTALTEHFLLTYPLASPIIWLTGNPVLAYNIVFLLAWPLNALAAYALARELTGSWRAALIGGFAFGFAPYWPDHLSHLQLLLAFGMPLGLLGLHRSLRTHRWQDAAMFGAGWLITALANAYTLVFFPILVVLWCVWFVRPREWRHLVRPATAALIASLPLVPLLYGYSVRQMALGVTRSYGDARLWAADASGLIGVSFREWFWAGWLPHDYGEGSLFPGLTIATLAVLAVAYGPRVLNRVRGGADLYVRRYRPWSRGLLAVGAVLALMAFARWDAYRPYRIFTVAALALVAALFTSARFRASWTQRDPVMFYAVAAVCFWLLALGPEPAWRGQRLLTYGPYRLFFALHAPVVVRVSARAWAGVLPCLAMLAAFGIRVLIDRLPRGRNAIVTAAAVMIAAECWFVEGTKAVPPRMAAGLIPAGATVLDVPIDDAFANAAAQYRAVRGDYRTINGYSGYDSPEFVRLILAFRDRRYDLVDRYRRHDLYVIVRPGADASFTGWLQSNGAVRQSEAADAVVYRLPGRGGG